MVCFFFFFLEEQLKEGMVINYTLTKQNLIHHSPIPAPSEATTFRYCLRVDREQAGRDSFLQVAVGNRLNSSWQKTPVIPLFPEHVCWLNTGRFESKLDCVQERWSDILTQLKIFPYEGKRVLQQWLQNISGYKTQLMGSLTY